MTTKVRFVLGQGFTLLKEIRPMRVSKDTYKHTFVLPTTSGLAKEPEAEEAYRVVGRLLTLADHALAIAHSLASGTAYAANVARFRDNLKAQAEELLTSSAVLLMQAKRCEAGPGKD